MKSHVCPLPDGSDGLCCKTRITTKTGLVNPIIRDLAKRNKDFSMQDRKRFNSFSAFRIRKAAEIGQSFAENVTRTSRKTLDKTKFSSFLHAKNQQQSSGIDVLCKTSFAFTEATRNLMSDRRMTNFDLRILNFVDFDNSALNGLCKKNEEFDCTSAMKNKFRTIDGSCNNLKKPKVGIKSEMSLRILNSMSIF